MKEITYLSSDEIKEEELKILKAFKRFCEAEELSFSLCGGTLLGAARHQSFIPWDDDIDVAMPRPEYERLISLSDKLCRSTGYNLIGYCGIAPIQAPLLKVVNPCIAVKSDYEFFDSEIWIDIIPIDGLPEDASKFANIYRCATLLRHALYLATSSPRHGRNYFRRASKLILGPVVRFPCVMQAIACCLNNYGKRIPYGSTSYVGAVTWGAYGVGEAMNIDEFEKQESLKFVDEFFPVPFCWKTYLTGVYGDYMQLPPEDKRINHAILAWRIDEYGKEGSR